MLSYQFISLTGDVSYSFSIRAATNGGIGQYANITTSTHAGGEKQQSYCCNKIVI